VPWGTAHRRNARSTALVLVVANVAFPLIPFPSYRLSASDRPGAVKGARLARRSEPLTASTDLESYGGRERGFRAQGPTRNPEYPLKTPGDSMLYVYDFGGNWRHNVTLEKILPASGMVRPVCIAGERHCPPEDVGGVPGYTEFLEVIFEPGHEEYEHYVRWAGGPSPLNRSVGRFQPEEFNIMAVNDALSRMRWPSASKQNDRQMLSRNRF